MSRIRRDVHWTGPDDYRVQLTGETPGSPQAVYDLLADLPAHLEWAGGRQYRIFRLLDLDAEPGPVAPGLVFRTTGTVPMLRVHWDNHNTVVEAQRPRVFSFSTDGEIDWSSAPWWDLPPHGGVGRGAFLHRYEITPTDHGSRVTYTMQQTRFDNPPWGMRWPGVRIGTHRLMVPRWFARGFGNLLRMAADEHPAAQHDTTRDREASR